MDTKLIAVGGKLDLLLPIFQIANTLTPLGIIGLLIGLLYLMLLQGRRVKRLSDNHLHDVLETLQRIERTMESNFARILERLER